MSIRGLKNYLEFNHFLRFLDSFKTGFGQLLVVWLVAFETKISHVLVQDTF